MARTDQVVKVAPGFPGHSPQILLLLKPDLLQLLQGSALGTDPIQNRRGRDPEEEKRRARRRPGDAPDSQCSQDQRCNARDDEELGAEGIQMRRGCQDGHLGGLPLEQVALAHAKPVTGAKSSVGGEVCLMRKESAHDDSAIEVAVGLAPCAMVTLQALHQAVPQLHQEGNGENGSHECAGCRRSGMKPPTAEQQQQRGDGQEAAAQVVEDFPAVYHR